jgi:hypothetical protein
MDARLLVQRYSNEKVLVDREDPRLTLGWDRTYESGLFGLKADYEETTSRTTELTSTGVFNNRDGTQKTKSLLGKWQHEISPKWSVLTESGYRDIIFDNSGTLGGYSLSDIGSKLTYANTDKLSTSAQLTYALYRPDDLFDNTKLSRLIFGANYQVSEGLNVEGRSGFYNLSGEQSGSGLESGVKASLTTERMLYNAELNRELVASGVGGFQKTDTLKLGVLFNVSERDRVGADYYLGKSKSDSDLNISYINYDQIGAFYERNLTNKWLTRFSASHKELSLPGVRSRGNVIGLTLVYDTLSF